LRLKIEGLDIRKLVESVRDLGGTRDRVVRTTDGAELNGKAFE
jgi:hypothetical protein